MLRPERMSRVSVTGTKRVMDEVIETVHDLNLVHLVDYDGSWEGFSPGDPMGEAETVSEHLVTVRSIESILDLEDEDAAADVDTSLPEGEAFEAELEEIRSEVNDLDDQRGDCRDELRAIEERIEAAEPFVDLGIDLDLLGGYDTLTVRVGEGDAESVRRAVAGADGVAGFETYAGERTVAAFVRTDDPDALDDALVGAEFTTIEVPDAEGDPEAYVEELERERERVETELERIETELEELKLEAGRFLLTAERQLTIEVQKAEAPLSFATTENAFVAEGWIPTDRYPDLVEALTDAVGDRVEVEELERADYDPPESDHGQAHATETEAVATDGGTEASIGRDAPPVIQSNPSFMKPFELLVETINRPAYWGFDPTVVLFLTFPAFFGFMIGDVGYGLLYVAIAYLLWDRADSPALRSLGGVGLWAGGFTILFGFFYGEIFGLHTIGDVVWGGEAPIHKGLQPVDAKYARAWLAVVVLVGVLHLTVGYAIGFVQHLQEGLREAVLESGSWLSVMLGIWIWVFSRHGSGLKPEFIYTVFDGEPFALGFAGLPEAVGFPGALAVIAVGFVLILIGEYEHLGGPGLIAGTLETFSLLVNVLSYARIVAVLLAKAGMAFVVNLLFFGVYVTEEEGAEAWHFGVGGMPAEPGVVFHGHEVTGILFGGLLHSGIAGVLGGLVILVLGHLLVLGLGITSAGLQAVRLEYVEFFDKFYYEGESGDPYEPFGYGGRAD